MKLYKIKELRLSTGMTQKAFAETFGIPLRTLQKWEQGEASPAPYFLVLLARSLPSMQEALEKVITPRGEVYFFDNIKKIVFDVRGNEIRIQEDLKLVKKQNLGLYLEDLFQDFYAAQDRFNRDCRYDLEEEIIWTR